ncbi:MAG: hypothetical protein J0L84_21035, partial [Verrucomicrobia bacterium]|nr:hypothetical protein [Verrucomicrobiota bacterium]
VTAAVWGVVGAGIAMVAGRWSLSATAAGLTVLAVVVLLRPACPVHRRIADGLVTVVPGLGAGLFR